MIHRPDLVDAADIEYHGMPGFPYGDLHLGMLERWHNVPNFIKVQLSWSHDLKQWHRPPTTEPFIDPTSPWNQGWSTCCSSGPVQVGNQLWFYFGGRSDCHFHAKQAPPRYSVVGLATITVDRFASISAGFMEGKLVTVPMTWPGGDLLLNASTTRHHDGYPLDGGGQMQVEVHDDDGWPLEGFCGDDHAVFTGNVPSRERLTFAPCDGRVTAACPSWQVGASSWSFACVTPISTVSAAVAERPPTSFPVERRAPARSQSTTVMV